LIAQGAVDCLFKPFEPSDLLQALKAALQVSMMAVFFISI